MVCMTFTIHVSIYLFSKTSFRFKNTFCFASGSILLTERLKVVLLQSMTSISAVFVFFFLHFISLLPHHHHHFVYSEQFFVLIYKLFTSARTSSEEIRLLLNQKMSVLTANVAHVCKRDLNTGEHRNSISL